MDTTALVDAWDAGQTLAPERWAVAMLAAARVGTSTADVARLPVGVRDAGLIALRCEAFGSALVAGARCPACDTAVETELDARDLLCDPAPADHDGAMVHGDWRVAWRLPDTHDLVAIAGATDVDAAEAALASRCLSATSVATGASVPIDDLPDDVVATAVARMGRMDPQADVALALHCPECRHAWELPFDIVSFLWHEVDAAARHLLHDVHDLASSYGWAEADILAMSPARRRWYLSCTRR